MCYVIMGFLVVYCIIAVSAIAAICIAVSIAMDSISFKKSDETIMEEP